MKHADETPPVPPVRPDNDECCRSGCDPCIFDLYALEMERYRAALAAWEKKQEECAAHKNVIHKPSLK